MSFVSATTAIVMRGAFEMRLTVQQVLEREGQRDDVLGEPM